MTRFGFVTWDGGGNVPPAVGMAQELASRGHDVVFIGYEVQRKSLEAKEFDSWRFDAVANSIYTMQAIQPIASRE